MFVSREKEEQFRKEMLDLFKDKIEIKTKKPKDKVNLYSTFDGPNLEEVERRLKSLGINEYTIELNDIYYPEIIEYTLTTDDIIVEYSKDELKEKFQDIVRYFYVNNSLENGSQYDKSSLETIVVESKYKELIVIIIKKILNIDINELNFIDVVFDEYKIDGLIWLTVDCDLFSLSNYLSYNCLIDNFIIRDINEQLSIYSRFVEPHDKRNTGQYFRIDLNESYRSRWEANFARILNYLGISFEYESENFYLNTDLINQVYVPDFFLSDNKIIEMKGFWDADSRKKVKVFAETNPNYELMILDGDMYKTLDTMYSHKIPNWESYSMSFAREILPVVGITQPGRREFVKKLSIGDTVQLIREKDNPYDAYAIKVLNGDGNHLGYISAEWAFIYASKMDIGMTFEGVVKAIEPKVLKITVTRKNREEVVIYDFLQEK